MAKVNLILKPRWVICRKNVFFHCMVMHIRKRENKVTSFKEQWKEKFKKMLQNIK